MPGLGAVPEPAIVQDAVDSPVADPIAGLSGAGHAPATVSVVVYCDGRLDSLSATLEGLARQTLGPIDVALAGEVPAHEDLSRIVPSRFTSTLTTTAAASDPNTARLRNDALGKVEGRYVLELRSGDYVEPAALEKAAWALETTPRAGLAVFEEPQGAARRVAFGRAGRGKLEGMHLDIGGHVLRLAAWSELGGFEAAAPAVALDADLAVRMIERGWRVMTIPEALCRRDSSAEPAGHDNTATRWLRRRYGAFDLRARMERGAAEVKEMLRRRAPILFALPRWFARKIEVEGLTDRRKVLRHPLDSGLRFMPRPIKGRLWQRLGLPMRPEPWTYEPPDTRLPDPSRLAPSTPEAGGAREIRLLVIHHYLTDGGADQVVLNLLSRIDRERFEVHLVTTDPDPDGDYKPLPRRRFAEQTASLFELPTFLPREHFLRFLIEFIEARQIDVVLISLSIFAYQALPKLRAACPDTAFVDLLHAEAPYAPMDQIRLARRYREHLDRRVVTTELVAAAQVARYGETPDRVGIIPNGIDTAYFDPEACERGILRRELRLDAATSIVLYFGRMSEEKQPMHLVETADRLRGRSDIAFVLLGEGPQTLIARKAIAARKLANVYLRPPRADIREALADADVMMFPSQREGLSMAGLESMAMAKAIVASRVPGWTDLISDGEDGLLVSDGDFEGYAAAITGLLADPGRRDRIARAARDKVARTYELTHVVSAWETLFEGLATSQRESRAARQSSNSAASAATEASRP
jgi:glycosyltransferase involved in cell wall biosynthesis